MLNDVKYLRTGFPALEKLLFFGTMSFASSGMEVVFENIKVTLGDCQE